MKPKVIFMGTPDFAVPVLEVLIKLTDVVLVVTQPDKLVGRKQELSYSPIKKKALENNIKVFQPIKLRKEMDEVLNCEADLIVTCAYGQILPLQILNHPKIAPINVHASLLPKLRGGAPIHHAIIDGYKETGVTIMYMAEGMDDGDIISQEKIIIDKEDNVGTLHDKLSMLGASLLEKTLPSILSKTNNRIKQDESLVTFAPTIKREDEHIDFNKNGEEIINLIRGLNPWPLSNIILNDLECKVIDAEFIKKDVENTYFIIVEKNKLGITCLDGVIYLKTIKPFGKKIMSISDYLNGIRNATADWSVK
ncbi:MAG: methionyl-tRNA formyltransferase [Bacilli bacterium]|nr:methionyl-tRNA formyltransferase [Bacilli bacterium]